jgi:UDP-N-acetylmuramate dehydrogenase
MVDISGRIKRDVPLSRYTTIGIGGPAKIMAVPKNRDELWELIEYAEIEGLPIFVLGGGSDTLFPDEGFPGLVVRMGSFNHFEVKGNIVSVGPGLLLSRLLNLLQEAGLSGLEPLVGIPGEVGGAIAKNAGSFGREIQDVLERVTILTWDGETVELPAKELCLGYRSSRVGEMGVIVEAKFSFKEGDPEKIREEMERHLEKRKSIHPVGVRTSGCVFKNPPDAPPAGKLLEMAGFKGKGLGGLKFSEVHANFMVNEGKGTAKEALELINMAKEKVYELFKVELEEEIVIVGNHRG